MKPKSIAPLAITMAIAATAILYSSDDPPVVKNADSIDHDGAILATVTIFTSLDKDPTAMVPETLDIIKTTRTIKQSAHLSRPDQRGEHAFPNFIRQATADPGARGHAHGKESRCRGSMIASLLAGAGVIIRPLNQSSIPDTRIV